MSTLRATVAGLRALLGAGRWSTSQRPGERDPLGPAGERLAAKHLRRKGHRVLHRNLMTPVGEADLVTLAPDRRTIVIVEVKTRRLGAGAALAPDGRMALAPELAVNHRKRQKLILVARAIAKRRGWIGRPIRIDVVAVEWPEQGRPVVRHHENAVRG